MKPAQILLTTILVLTLATLAIFGITTAVVQNNRQVFGNIEYGRSFNLAENRVLQYSNLFAMPKLDFIDLRTSIDDGNCREDQAGNGSFVCSFEEEDNRRTVLQITETNQIDDFRLRQGEYFDLILDGTKPTFNLEWQNEAALDLELVYESNGEEMSRRQVMSPEGIYDLPIINSDSNGFLANANPDFTNQQLQVVMGNLNSTIPNDAYLKRLRISFVSRSDDAIFRVRPEILPGNVLPNQVRRVEAVSYNADGIDNSTPIVTTQFPLSPSVPSVLRFAQSFDAGMARQCGNGVVEAAEQCDDGNDSDTDQCTNTCELNNLAICETEFQAQGGAASNFPGVENAGKYLYVNPNVYQGDPQWTDTQTAPSPNHKLAGRANAAGDEFIIDVRDRADTSIHFEFLPRWVPDRLQLYVQKTDGTEIIYANDSCFGRNELGGYDTGDRIYGRSYPPDHPRAGEFWQPGIAEITGTESRNRPGPNNGTCTIRTKTFESVPIEITEDIAFISIKVINGKEGGCEGSEDSTEWGFRVYCDEPYVSSSDFSWTGDCGPGGNDGT